MEGKAVTIKKDVKVMVPDFSMKKKIEVVSLYQDNNYDLEKTAKETGLTPAQIKQWHREMGRNVFKGRNEVVATAGEVEMERLRMAEEVSRDLVRVRQIALQRLEELIQKATDLEKVTKALDALTRAIKEEEGDVQPGSKIKKGGTYQIINQQFNVMKQARQKKEKNGDN